MTQIEQTSDQSDESIVSKISERIEKIHKEKIEERQTIKGIIADICGGSGGNRNGGSIASHGSNIARIEGEIEAIRMIESIIDQEIAKKKSNEVI